MLDKPVYVTNKGKREMEAELEHLQTEDRQRIIGQLHEVKSGGDWMENTEVRLFEDELAFVDRRISDIEDMLANAKLIEQDQDLNTVNIGDTVVIQEEDNNKETYRIVGVAESNPSKGLISNESPLGIALLKHKVGESVVVSAPSGELTFKIVNVK